MTALLERLLWASVAGIPAAIAALLLCRLPRLAPIAKVWICRLAILKFAVSLFATSAILVSFTSTAPQLGTHSDSRAQWLFGWLTLVWVCGALVVGFHLNTSRRQASAVEAMSRTAEEPILRRVARLSRLIGLSQRVGVKRSACSQPLIMGLTRKTILLPCVEDREVQDSVLCHELAHAKHRDLEWALGVHLLMAALWFHPLVRLLEQELGLWQEAAADKLAQRVLGVEPGQQAEEIVHALSSAGRFERANLLAMGHAGGVAIVVRRVRELYSPKASVWMGAVAFVLVATMLVPVRLGFAPAAENRLQVSPMKVPWGPIVSRAAR